MRSQASDENLRSGSLVNAFVLVMHLDTITISPGTQRIVVVHSILMMIMTVCSETL